MRTAVLKSGGSTSDGTFGVMTLDDGTSFASGELPWRDNKNGVSCIPAGIYKCIWIFSPKHGECYQITGVPKREMIEIHSANYMGAADLGKKSQLLGCIALGKASGILDGQFAILQSKTAIAEFEANMNKEDFMLTLERVGEL